MQNRVNEKCQETWLVLKEKLKEIALNEEVSKQDLINFVNNYEFPLLTKEDLERKKKEKTELPANCRCEAKKSDEEQCSRRKKKGCDYCGTHEEKQPFGVIAPTDRPTTHQINVWVQEIKGILYHIDSNGNVYKQEDVMLNRMNPKIIAKYVLSEDGVYTIPEFGL
jgi:hypothetical protein